MSTWNPAEPLASVLSPSCLVLAHGGRFTWDEALMVAIPIAIFAGVLVTANRRAKELQAERDAGLADGTDEAPVDDEQADLG